MHYLKKNFATSALLFISAFALSAQITINEYSASNLESFTDSFGKTEDWIELYNTSNTPVDISGWYLSDKESKPTKWSIPEGTVIDPNGFLVFLCSGRDMKVGNEFHTNFKLAQTKGSDIVLLSNASGQVLEMHDLDLTLVEHSRCRKNDGGDEWVVSTGPSFGSSNNLSPQVNGYTVSPSIELAAGFYSGEQTVEITNNEPGSTLRYTTNGLNPTASSAIYTTALIIDNTTVVKAQSFSDDPAILPGKMDFSTFFIDEEYSLAVFSVAADEVLELAGGDGFRIPIGSLEYFNTNKEREATSFGSLNRHGQDSWILDHRSLDWISRDEMGYSKAVDAPIFGYSDRNEYQKFMFRNSGDDNYPATNDGFHDGATHIRDEYVHTLAQLGDMHLDQRAVERVVLFLNGQYWGVYGMRERPVDHDYTNEYYDQGKYEIQYLSTWRTTEAEYGGLEAVAAWEQLRNHIMLNDMSVAENYQIAEDSLDMLSLIDYMTMNMNVVAVDWLNYNTGWWRGLNPEGKHKKWGYILWDLDATFDYYINYTGVPDVTPNADPCDIEEISESMDVFFGEGLTDHAGTLVDTLECFTITNGESPYPGYDPIFQAVVNNNPSCCDIAWSNSCQSDYEFFEQFLVGNYGGNVGYHEKIFLKLIRESSDFRQLYYSRYADLMNTVFTCENMIGLLDSMLAVIEPEMPRQIARWGGTISEWESNVSRMKGFISERCTKLGETALTCFEGVDGLHELTLLTEPDGIGEIDLNTLDIETFPWVGEYFGTMENKIKAKVFNEFEDEYEFSHWESKVGSVITPSVTDRKASYFMSEADTLIAVFATIGSVNTEDLSTKYDIHVYPNPATTQINLELNLDETKRVQAELMSPTGKSIVQFLPKQTNFNAGKQLTAFPIPKSIPTGIYYLSLKIDGIQKSFKVNIVKN